MLVFCSPAFAEETTLCHSFEEIYFSCHINNNIISLCASGNLSPERGYVQYRYGKIENIEFQHPKNPAPPPKKRIEISEITIGHIDFTNIKFRSDSYAYEIYQGFPSGLYVKHDGKLIFNHQCDVGIYQQLNQRIFRGLETVAPDSNIDD
ncbi:hypothetical protein PBR20603_02308 [Pandoraea bronchicola]|uniref:Uncharacterized protein n=1 Tax=Pandoraea bronchicola TaxID=2508287 RepID=A0A5E5BR98_9BURK|nr:hypothetical protein PBR20603_02308 [Pandoraea bronchicola]